MAEVAEVIETEETEGMEDAEETVQAEETAQAEEVSSDWRSLVSEDLRSHAERFQSLDDVIKANVETRQRLSNAIFPLRKNAKEEDVAAFRKAIGVPERIEDYEINQPEGWPDDYFENEDVANRLKGFAEVAHASNVPQAGFQAILDWYFSETASEQAAMAAEDERFAEQAIAELRGKWGPANFEREKAYADRGAEWALGEDFEEFRNLKTSDGKYVADHPMVLSALNKIGRAVAEDTIGAMPVDQETADSLKSELNKLTEEQMNASAQGDLAKVRALDDKIMKIAARISGDSPIVGSQGRSA